MAHLDQIAKRLAHLATLVTDHPGVHPCPGERTPAGQALRLRTLRFVVAELEVPPAAMDVDLVAEVAHRHGRAFDVPAGTTGAELRRPRRLVGGRPSPQGEVE